MIIPPWKELSLTLHYSPELPPITTGYYSCLKRYLDYGYTPVSISLSSPISISLKLPELNPPYSLLKLYKSHSISEDEYLDIYVKYVLTPLYLPDIFNKISSFSSRVVLLCYESPFAFCHRHIVSFWLSKYTEYYYSYSVGELPNKNIST